jgi:hypothetical protein
LIADMKVFGGGTDNLEWSLEPGQRRENAAGPALTGETVAEANPLGIAFDLNA